MIKQTTKLILLAMIIVAGTAEISYSAENSSTISQKTVKLKAEETTANLDMVVKDNYIKAKYTSAKNRFMQGNVKASRDDFQDIVSKAQHDDYVFIAYAMQMAECGFFDISEELIRRLDNNLYTANYVKDIRKYYYPSGMVKNVDYLYLADAYAGIIYNNLAIETTSELLNSVTAEESDYKNYLIALGYYKSNNLNQALQYINAAELMNNQNVNYKVLKAKILADLNKPKQALKVLKEINKAEFKTVEFQTKIKAVNEYVQYKVEKEQTLKDYHLSYYYHLQEKSLLATKVLQSAILQSKKYAPQIFGLLGRIYYENNEPSKAVEFAQRAYSEDKKNYHAVLTLADTSYDERKFDEALAYYKIAQKLNKKDCAPVVGIAKSYTSLEKNKKSKKIYEKMLKKKNIDEEILIGSLSEFPQRVDEYLPKAVSVDISNNDVWLELAHIAIKDGNYNMAETFLNNSYYIDENNFKYYYYLSQVLRAKGEKDKSDQLLIKCSRLNSDYESQVNSGYSVYEK